MPGGRIPRFLRRQRVLAGRLRAVHGFEGGKRACAPFRCGPKTYAHAARGAGRSTARLAGQVRFWQVVQYLFYEQWAALKAYANAKGVEFIGDIPIYVSPDSSDLWPTLRCSR